MLYLHPMIFLEIVGYVSMFSSVVPIGFGLITLRYLKVEHKSILILCFISLVVELLSYGEFNNFSFIKTYDLVEFFILLYFYKVVIIEQFNNKLKYFSYLLIVLVFLLNLNQQFFNESSNFNAPILNILYIVLSILVIYKTNYTKGKWTIGLTTKYINYSLLIYFSGTITLFLITGWFIENDNDQFKYLWLINNLLVTLTYTMFAFGLWKSKTLKT